MKEISNNTMAGGRHGFNWIAAILSPLSIILMEILFFYPWLISAGKWSRLFPDHIPLSIVSVFILTVLGLVCTRFFTEKRWPLVQIRLCIISCGLIAIAAATGIEYAARPVIAGAYPGSTVIQSLIAAVAGLYFWWRGMTWGLSNFNFDRIYRLFLIGLFALVALALVWGAGTEDGMPSLGFYIAGFFFCSLIALSLSRLHSVQAQLKVKGKEAFSFSRQWASIVVIVTGVTVLVGLAAASLFSFQFGAIITDLLTRASDLLMQGLYYVFIPVGFLMNIFIDFLRFIISLLQTGHAAQPAFSGNLTAPLDISQVFNGALSPVVSAAIKWSLFSLALAAVLWFLYRTIYRYAARKTGDNADEIQESLWSWSTFTADLRLFMNIPKKKIGRSKITPRMKILSSRPAQKENTGRLDIREIYRRLLARAEEIKLPRLQYETPLEYAVRLGAALPNVYPQLISLTDLYNSVRYGGIEPVNAQLEHANSTWTELMEFLGKIGLEPDSR